VLVRKKEILHAMWMIQGKTLGRATLILAGALLMVDGAASQKNAENPAWNQIDAARILEHIKILSSDEFEGRAPASKGEEMTVAFLEAQFKKLGLQPGNPNGTYAQKVPMVGITADPSAELVITKSGSGEKMTLKYADDFVARTEVEQPEVSVNADLLFVGYGAVAPEYQWDDYKGMDVKGKILVMLINDPPVPDPNDPTKLDDKVFKGRAMTYYGRWTYKYEMAAKLGAAGCLIIHETEPAAYPWGVVQSSNTGEQFDLATADASLPRLAVEGWLTYDKANALLATDGKDLEALKRAAVRRDFRPVPLGARASLTLKNSIRHIDSRSMVAKLEGADPKVKDEYVIYVAHWDHLGVGAPVNGDRIYHGAVDNASGVAGVLEIARAFTQAQPPPRRSILFLFVTGEEKGLLGSRYYAEHPLYPLTRTLAVLNVDGLNVRGRTRDFTVVGLGMSTLDDHVQAVAAGQGRVVKGDAEPEKGFYFRSDHFEFAKQGVPAFDAGSGVDYIDRPEGWGLQMNKKFTEEDYHKPSDRVKPDWDLGGAVQDLQLLAEVGYRVANAATYPAWKPGAEFKAKREAMMKAAKRIQ
jgi:Zn-dependent M28 family amino/carboxypeptidase